MMIMKEIVFIILAVGCGRSEWWCLFVLKYDNNEEMIMMTILSDHNDNIMK